MKLLWLDDMRDPMKDDWLVFSPISRNGISEVIWVKSYQEFVNWINENGLPDGICFDHDLGKDVSIERIKHGMSKCKSRYMRRIERSGFDACKWLVEYCMDNDKPLPLYNIQSANEVGKANIDSYLKSYLKSQNLTKIQ